MCIRDRPKYLYHPADILKNKTPNIKVNNGVNELNTPAIELLISVWAKENKKAGMKLPVNPTIARYLNFDQSICRNRIRKKGRKVREEIEIRRQATCGGE